MSAFSYVQSNLSVSGTTLAYPGNNTLGNVLLAYLVSYTGSLPTTLTDSLGNTWYQLWQANIASSATALYAAIAGASGANTVNASGLTGSYGWTILEYSSTTSYAICGLNTKSTFTGSATVVSSGASLAAPGVEVLAITFAYDEHSGHSWTSSAATIRQQSGSIPGGESMVAGDQDVTGSAITWAAPYTNSYSGSSATNTNGGAVFLVAVGGGGGAGGAYVFIGD